MTGPPYKEDDLRATSWNKIWGNHKAFVGIVWAFPQGKQKLMSVNVGVRSLKKKRLKMALWSAIFTYLISFFPSKPGT